MTSRERNRLERTLREAEGYFELGMPAHALAALQRRGKLVHADARGCYLLGEALRELDRWKEALYPLERSADLMPDDIHVWLSLGWCYKRTGQLLRAIDALEEALHVDPSVAILHYNLACYWSLAQNRRRALRHLTRAFEIDGNFRELVHAEPDFDPIRDDPGFQSLTELIA